MQNRVPPLALLFSSIAYFYNSVNNVVPFRTNVNTTLIDTDFGILRGTKEVSRTGRSFYGFRGIPYATPPIKNLRFEPPVPWNESWEGVRDATRYGSQCLQMNIITRNTILGNENCLFLNIFTPKLPTESNPNPNLPVLVFIHGGLFMSGSSNIYRPKYIMDKDVVLVTLNYRLTSFGFLNTGDEIVTGNMGLKDQAMALSYVKDHIKLFGGDPNRVTLMGESAGGMSSHLHTLSPLSKGLLNRAISMSGTALSPWGFIQNPKQQAQEHAEGLGCPTEPSKAMVQCLKLIDARIIARSHIGYINALARQKHSVFGPTVEAVINNNTFLPDKPINLMKSGRINPIPWMTGVNSEEGLVYMIPLIRNSTMNKLVNTNWEKFAPILLHLNRSEVSPEVLTEIREYYLNKSDIGLPTMTQSANMLSDRTFFLDNHDAVVLHSRVAPVYPYFYKYNGRYAMAKLLFVKSPFPVALPDRFDFAIGTGVSWFAENVLRIREPNYFGIAHSDEIPLFFNSPVIRREVVPEDEDYTFSKRIVHLWASFAATGVPDSISVNGPKWDPIWQEVNGDRPLKRLHLDDEFEIADEPFFKRLEFWKSLNISYI